MSKLILIDGNAIIHRAYHALPNTLTTKNGEPINAVYGYTSMLLRIIQDLAPTHIAVAIDLPEPTFRHKEFEDYQAQRPEADDELKGQFQKAHEVTKAFRIPLISQSGYEADDVIGTIANNANIDEVIIVTGDRDILQLVNDKVKVYLPVRGLSDAKLFGEKEVKEKMGIPPKLIDDFKGLVGDPSDNYKGVKGIGPVTAKKLLEEYGSFVNIYKNLDKIDKPLREKLAADRESGEISYKLATIVTDAPIDFKLDECRNWQIDSNEIMELFDKFGFRTLRKRVQEVGKTIASKNQIGLF